MTNPDDCLHPNPQMRYLLDSHVPPRRLYLMQCPDCGQRIGKAWLPHPPAEQAAGIKPFDCLAESRAKEWIAGQTRQKYETDRANTHAEYERYILADPMWRARRALVLARAQGVCECCLTRAATQVHHTTYHNIYDEVLWDLRAVCDECHAKIHGRSPSP